MAPKKSPKKKPPKTENEMEPELPAEEWLDKDLNLVNDLNENFFRTFQTRIEYLVRNKRKTDATHMKKLSDLLYNLHHKYVIELEENNVLRPEVERSKKRLQLAVELTGNTEGVVGIIKNEIGVAWMEADAAQDREGDVQKKHQELMVKCEAQAAQATGDEVEQTGPMGKYRNLILRERDRLNADNNDLEKRLQIMRFYSEGLEILNKDLEEVNGKANTRTKILLAEKGSLEIKNKALTMALEESKQFGTRTLLKLNSTTQEMQALYTKFAEKSLRVDKQRQQIDVMESENANLKRMVKKLEFDLTASHKVKRELETIIRNLRNDDKLKDIFIAKLNRTLLKGRQDYEVLSQRVLKLDHFNNVLAQDIIKEKTMVEAMEKELMMAAKKHKEISHMKDVVAKEREHLRHSIANMTNTMNDLRHTIAIKQNHIQELDQTNHKLNLKIDENSARMARLEKERHDLVEENSTLERRLEDMEDELKTKKSHITQLDEKLKKKTLQLFNMNRELDEANTNKAILQRNLESRTQERNDLRELQAKYTYEIAQLSAETNLNQKQINGLNLKVETVIKAKKEVETTLRNTETTLANTRDDLKEVKRKNSTLLKTVQEDERRFIKLTSELDNTTKEKNLVGLQMVRRNDELVFLKDRLHIVQTSLDRGQQHFNQSLNDISLLKCEIKMLQTERDCLSRAIKSTADMRFEVVRLHRTLNQERIKNRALMNDLKTPATIHRWRILKGTDPNRYELIQKISAMHRRIVRLETEKTNLKLELDTKSESLNTLKKTIEFMPPASEVKEKLVRSQEILRKQQKKLKVLNAELMISGIEVNARDCIIEEFKATLKATQETKESSYEELQRKTCCT